MAARWTPESLAAHAQEHGWLVWHLSPVGNWFRTLVLHRDESWSATAWATWRDKKLNKAGTRVGIEKSTTASMKKVAEFIAKHPGGGS